MMKKYNNWGIDMGGLSMTDPKRYRKINAVLTNKGKKKDFLDRVNTIPLEYVSDVVDEGSTPDDTVFNSELKVAITKGLSTLTPREEIVLKMRFNIGHTLEDIGIKFNIGMERVRQIEAKALRKLRNNNSFRDFLDAT
tara:strand:- start:34 stop:447 length:414 start_codon:yes stop_codon:yes gene_type:complete